MQRLWNEINSKTDVYLQFREYESPDALWNELTKYTFDKAYDHDTADLVMEALSKIFKCKVLIQDGNPQKNLTCIIGHTFSSAIYLIKSREDYNLLIQATDQHSTVKPKKEHVPVKCIKVERLVNFLI